MTLYYFSKDFIKTVPRLIFLKETLSCIFPINLLNNQPNGIYNGKKNPFIH